MSRAAQHPRSMHARVNDAHTQAVAAAVACWIWMRGPGARDPDLTQEIAKLREAMREASQARRVWVRTGERGQAVIEACARVVYRIRVAMTPRCPVVNLDAARAARARRGRRGWRW